MAGDYGSMTTRILDELNRGSDTTVLAQVKLEVLSAIAHYERQRFWFNETQETASLVTSQANLAVPTDMLEIDSLTITYSSHFYELDQMTWAHYRAIEGDDTSFTTSVPTHFCYYANQFWFYPRPNSSYSVKWSGLKQLTALSASTDTNNWMVEGEELIRCRAKASWRVKYPEEMSAMAEKAQMAGSGYLSSEERTAHLSLIGTSVSRISTGRIMPMSF